MLLNAYIRKEEQFQIYPSSNIKTLAKQEQSNSMQVERRKITNNRENYEMGNKNRESK